MLPPEGAGALYSVVSTPVDRVLKQAHEQCTSAQGATWIHVGQTSFMRHKSQHLLSLEPSFR